MTQSDLIPLVESLPRASVLCAGDVMLDHYVYGKVERISPEAPIPVLRVAREERSLGGAGNVLRNLHALGVAASFVSVIGDDSAGAEVAGLVGALGASRPLLTEGSRITTVKTRYIADTQQMIRADREVVAPLKGAVRGEFLRLFEAALPGRKVVILSDYAKGVLADGIGAE
ncbi:MAG TPA: PfkB family carbohydrate kinase, partial [Stellaceae bacterium]|nr:PfkB family carbohydrate kinase [Stellaceae bacterium]